MTHPAAGNKLSIGHVIKLSCIGGWEYESGDTSRTCQADGTLSGTPLVCASPCPDGWLPSTWGMCYGNDCDGYCWYNQAEAQRRCESVNATLATARSQAEMDKVMGIRRYKEKVSHRH